MGYRRLNMRTRLIILGLSAGVGSVIGVVMGAYEPFNKQDQSVRSCLRGKGYELGA